MIKAATGQVILASLFCFLVLFRPIIAVAEWHTSEYGDAFDDQKRILAATRTRGASLVLKYDEYMEDVYLDFILDGYIGERKKEVIRARFDKQQIFEIKGWIKKEGFIVTDRFELRNVLR